MGFIRIVSKQFRQIPFIRKNWNFWGKILILYIWIETLLASWRNCFYFFLKHSYPTIKTKMLKLFWGKKQRYYCIWFFSTHNRHSIWYNLKLKQFRKEFWKNFIQQKPRANRVSNRLIDPSRWKLAFIPRI